MNQRTAQVSLLGRALHVVSSLHDRHIQILQKRAKHRSKPADPRLLPRPSTPPARLAGGETRVWSNRPNLGRGKNHGKIGGERAPDRAAP